MTGFYHQINNILKNRGGSFQDLTPLELPFDRTKFELVCQHITAPEVLAVADILVSVDSENMVGNATPTGIDQIGSSIENVSITNEIIANQSSSNKKKIL